MKKKSTQFDKFTKKKSNAAIKEGFKQEKRKWKKEREEYFDKQKQAASLKSRQAAEGIQQPVIIKREQSSSTMPLNKYIAHCGFSSRRDAAETVKQGKVKVNGVVIMEPGHKVSPSDEVVVNGKKAVVSKNLI